MDPIDQEEPFSTTAKVLMIAAVIAVVYLIVRFAVVIPEWGWQLIFVVTLVGTVTYYRLAFRAPRAPTPPPRGLGWTPGRLVHYVSAVLLAMVLTLPAWVALYYWWEGRTPWD